MESILNSMSIVMQNGTKRRLKERQKKPTESIPVCKWLSQDLSRNRVISRSEFYSSTLQSGFILGSRVQASYGAWAQVLGGMWDLP